MIKFFIISFLICLVFASEDKLWDLGVVIDKKNNTIIQQELDLETLELNNISNNIILHDVKALHSDNFIAPIIKEFKSPSLHKNITKAYDEIIAHLSLKEKIKLLKEVFLNKQFSQFISVFKSMDKATSPISVSLYVQNLYFSNQHHKALDLLSDFEGDTENGDILFFKIKSLIKLKKIEEAYSHIETFLFLYPNSDYLNYILFEKNLLELNHAK
tara:strand:+ start:20 stop:664 length:645 start_codon:yes stop_codon:yes gene_type:complete